MKLLFSLSFIWSMSIGILIIPSLFPFPAYINLVGLVFILLLHLSFNYNFRATNNFIVPVVIYIFLSSVLSSDQGVVNFAKQLFSLGFMALVFASGSEMEHKKLLQSYIVFCFIMAACGSLASILVNAQIVSLEEFKLNLTEITDSRFNWDESIENGFNAPYGLGLVLTKGSSLYYFLGIPFFRSSGWSYEPTFASFFTVPSLILLIRESLFSKKNRIIMGSVIIFFLLCCFSVASIASLFAVLLVFRLLDTSKNLSGKIIWIFLASIIGFFVVSFYNSFKSALPGIDLIESKLSDDSLSGVNIFSVSGTSIAQLIPTGIIFIYICSILWMSAKAIRSEGLHQTMGLILLYLLFHSAKGSWYHTITLDFTFVFFLYLANENVGSKRISPSSA